MRKVRLPQLAPLPLQRPQGGRLAVGDRRHRHRVLRGSRRALGVYISQQAALFHFADAWAAIIVGSLFGLAFYGLILLAERLVMPWHVSQRLET